MEQIKAREITEKAIESERNAQVTKCVKWAKAKSDTIIYKRASQGFSNVEIKTPLNLERTKIVKAFSTLGYDVITKSNNKLLVKW